MVTISVEERFWSKVKKTDYCWIWTASFRREGYGSFKDNKKTISSHRFSWELHNGPILNDLQVLHKCDNPSCVRPSHLFLGTHQDNMKDMNKKGRNHSIQHGEKNIKSKLTEKEVLKIRYLYSLGNTSHRKLAKLYNLDHSQIGRIIRRINWGHI